MENVNATEGMLIPNATAGPGSNWNFMVVRSLGDGEGGNDVGISDDSHGPYEGLDDVAKFLSEVLNIQGPLIPYSGPGNVHIPAGSVVERFKWQREATGWHIGSDGLFNITPNGIERQ